MIDANVQRADKSALAQIDRLWARLLAAYQQPTMLWQYDIAIAKRREMTKGAGWSKSTRASSIAVALPRFNEQVQR
jgi:hypothetical protein